MIRSLALCAALCAGTAQAATGWPEWQEYSQRFIQADGRVVDLTFDQKSTSEGQSYGLFFALVANDRERFDAILKWTSLNLAGGQLGRKAPGWWWGKQQNGSWGLIDSGPAADGDLWIAYTLLEAARLWHAPQYEKTGRELLDHIKEHEVAKAGDAGTLLLPGPYGFDLGNGRYRYDPSYIPGFILEYFAGADTDGPWRAIWDSYLKLAPKIFANGIAPDLCRVDSRGRVSPDPERPEGGYDAIRVYLWAGMDGTHSAALLPLLKHYAQITADLGAPPEKIDPASGSLINKWSPIGYSGAMLPYLKAIGDGEGLEQQLSHLKRARLKSKLGGSTNYYDQSLILYGTGWLDGQYRFIDGGRLQPRWSR